MLSFDRTCLFVFSKERQSITRKSVLKEYSSLQENQYNVRYIHTVLIVHVYFAPRAVVMLKQCIKLLQCIALWPWKLPSWNTSINDVTGPAAGPISYVSSQWYTVARVLHGPGLGPRARPARSPWAGPGHASMIFCGPGRVRA